MSAHAPPAYAHVTDPLAILLGANESPSLPGTNVLSAMQAELRRIHRYPDPTAASLREKIAGDLRISPEQILVGHGASELLFAIAGSELSRSDEAVFAWPSYYAYPQVVARAGATARVVALDRSLTHDLQAMAAAVSDRCTMALVCNPNNPTGTAVSEQALVRFIDALSPTVTVILDEAYYEFARPEPVLSSGIQHPNLIRLRTFSKAHRLAGARVGYAVFGDRALAQRVNDTRPAFPVSGLAQAAALASLADQADLEAHVEATLLRRERLRGGLVELGLRPARSEANFVWARPPAGWSDLAVAGRLAGLGIHIACGSELCGAEGLRITVGSEDEIERALAALGEIGAAR